MLLRRSSPALVFFVGCTIAPLAVGIAYALAYSLGFVGGLRTGFTTAAWQQVVASGTFWAALGVSVAVATVAVSLATLLALTAVGLLARVPPTAQPRWLRPLYAPLALPPIIAAFVAFQWLGNTGMLARLLYQMGLLTRPEDFPALVNDAYYVGVIATQVFLTTPFLTLVLWNVYTTQKIEALGQIAQTLGATRAQIRWRVTWPVLLRQARPNLVLCFIVSMSSYEIPLLLGRQSPMMLSVLIGQKFQKFNLADIPQAYAMTVVYAALLLALVALFVRFKQPPIES